MTYYQINKELDKINRTWISKGWEEKFAIEKLPSNYVAVLYKKNGGGCELSETRQKTKEEALMVIRKWIETED